MIMSFGDGIKKELRERTTFFEKKLLVRERHYPAGEACRTSGLLSPGKPGSQQAICSPKKDAQVWHGFLENRTSESTGFQDWKF